MPAVLVKNQLIYYEEQGNGEPLILIHGVGLDHTMWEKQMTELAEHFRVVVYDMVGHGGSGHPPGPYTLSHFTQQLADLMDYLKMEKAHLVGFSMGGMVAQAFALHLPDKLISLTIMNAVANRTEEQKKAILARVEEVKKNGVSATVEAAINRWFNHDFLITEKAVADRIRKRLHMNAHHSYLAAYTLFATADQLLSPKLTNIKIPTLIITGENDIGSNPEMARYMHEKIADSEIIIVPNMKHMLPVEGFEIVNQIIRSFLDKHSVSVN
jgi:3-oxoadipate enol-lactonase